MTTTVTRRDLFKFGGLAALGVAGASTLAGCGQPKTVAEAAAEKGLADTGAATGPAFLAPQKPITDFAETHEYDVVVVGAGESGLSAVHTALEAGARVACVQNINAAQTTGNMAASIDLTQTDEAAVQACVSFINWKSDCRSNRDLVNIWAHNSQEALAWWAEEAARGGVESKPHDAVLSYNGYDIHLHANTYFHVEGNHNAAATVIAENLAAAGAEFFYNMPCKQLQTDESGAVTGVICEDADGAHHLFTATKGVILACGDYSSNQEMLDYYAPDTKGFSLFTDFRDGSGLVAGMNAGAIMTPHTHTKMIHGEPAAVRLEMPFLFVDQEGNRFMDETCCRMGYMNNFARPYLAKAGFADSTAAKFFSLVPANWESYYEEWKAASPYDISQYNGDNKVNPEKWITADTIEGLAEAMNAYAAENDWKLTNIDAAALADTVARYNELCAAGRDEDFGKAAKYLVPIEGGPYYAIPPRLQQAAGHPGRPRGRWQPPVPERGVRAHRRPVRRGQRLGPVLRRRGLPHGYRGTLHRPRHHLGLLHRPLGGEPVGHLPSHPPVPGRRSLPVGRAFCLRPLAPDAARPRESADPAASRPRHLL